MRKLLLIIFLFSLHKSHSQTFNKNIIDKIANKSDSLHYYYEGEDGDNFYDADSNMTGFISRVYRYSDIKAKNLVRVDELNKTKSDSSSIFYYFKNNQLIKVDARVLIHGDFFHQDFYFKNNKLIYSTPLDKPLFNPNDYLKRSKQYLKFKCKVCNPNYII